MSFNHKLRETGAAILGAFLFTSLAISIAVMPAASASSQTARVASAEQVNA